MRGGGAREPPDTGIQDTFRQACPLPAAARHVPHRSRFRNRNPESKETKENRKEEKMKTYTGRRRFFATKVMVDGRALPFRRDLRCHSPAEFEWGYGGQGPAQLALAILADHLGDDQEALNLYHRFKWFL